MASNFFGLSSSDKADLILEPAFILMYYGGFTYTEAMMLPVQYKSWFIKRIEKEFNSKAEAGNPQSRAAHLNSPDVRSLNGMSRQESPARVRRFT